MAENKSNKPVKTLAADNRHNIIKRDGLVNRILLIAIAVIGVYLIFFVGSAETISELDPYRSLHHFLLWRHTPGVLALLLLAIALYLILRYYFDVFSPLRKEIDKVSSVVLTRRDPETFTRDFAVIDEAFRDSRCFRDGWREFKKTLHKTAHETSGNVIYHNTKRPHVYLNERSISQFGREIRQLEFYPGIFVAVGLVLTFIGLLVALSAAGQAITESTKIAQTTDALKDETQLITTALKDLIAASAFKFMTSISGIGCSILLTIVSRHYVNYVVEKILTLQNHLERGLIHLSAEKIQLRVEKETNLLARGIREGFSDAITELAGSELRLFADRMGDIGKELQKADKIVKRLGSSYKTQLEKINTAFITTSQETAEQAKAFQKEISKSQRTFNEDLCRQYEQQFDRMAEAFNENFEEAQHKLSEFNTSIQTKLDESELVLLETSKQMVENSNERMSEHASEMSQSVENVFRRAGEEFKRLKELMDANYETSISELSKSNEEFLEASKLQIEEHSAEISESYRQMGEDVVRSVKSASDGFNENIGTRFGTLSEMTENLISATENALQDHNGLQDRSSAIIESLNSVAENLGTVKDEIVNVSEKTFSELIRTGEKLDAAADRIGEFSGTRQAKSEADFERLARTIDGLEAAMQGHLTHTVNSAETGRTLSINLENAVGKFTEQSTLTQGELIQAMSKLSDALADATAKITEAQSARSIFSFRR
jgi:hypothetical protein